MSFGTTKEQLEYKGLKIGSYLRELRTCQNMTIKELAEVAGLAEPNISNIENNLSFPRKSTVVSMLLGMEVDDYKKHIELYQTVRRTYMKYKKERLINNAIKSSNNTR